MAQRATSLGPKPSLCFCLFCFFVFLSLFLIEKPCFPHKNGHFSLFICVSLCFSLAFFGPPPFSVSRSLSLSCSFLSSFVPVFHFCFWFLLLLSVYLLFLSSCSFVFIFFLLVVLFCFESYDLICFCFASCFLVVVVLFFLLWYFLIFGNQSKTSLNKMEIP